MYEEAKIPVSMTWEIWRQGPPACPLPKQAVGSTSKASTAKANAQTSGGTGKGQNMVTLGTNKGQTPVDIALQPGALPPPLVSTPDGSPQSNFMNMAVSDDSKVPASAN